MKRIEYLCKQFIGTRKYKDYKIVVTALKIEITLYPQGDKDIEAFFDDKNNKQGKFNILLGLEAARNRVDYTP